MDCHLLSVCTGSYKCTERSGPLARTTKHSEKSSYTRACRGPSTRDRPSEVPHVENPSAMVVGGHGVSPGTTTSNDCHTHAPHTHSRKPIRSVEPATGTAVFFLLPFKLPRTSLFSTLYQHVDNASRKDTATGQDARVCTGIVWLLVQLEKTVARRRIQYISYAVCHSLAPKQSPPNGYLLDVPLRAGFCHGNQQHH
jgi:hypothetical protein